MDQTPKTFDSNLSWKIVGIVFVVNTHGLSHFLSQTIKNSLTHLNDSRFLGGPQLCFRYPTVLRDKVTNETMNAYASTLSESTDQEAKVLQRVSWGAADAEENRLIEELQQYQAYNLTSVVLGPLLIPKVRKIVSLLICS